MDCPLCGTGLRQMLLQPTVSIIACPSESCVYPFNLSVAQLLQQNLLITDVKTSDIMNGMEKKMVQDAQVEERIAHFISKEDNDVV